MTSLLPTAAEIRIAQRKRDRDLLVRELLDMAAERRQASLAEARGLGGHHEVSEALRREALTLELAASTIRRETQEAMR